MTASFEEGQRQRDAQRAASWWAAIDQRIEQHFRFYFMSGDEENPGALTAAIGQAMGETRIEARKEVKQLIEAERRAFDAKLAALEERLKSVR